MAKRPNKTVNIALQGGGAHGAFTWGVLDKLLEDGRLDIDGVCSCSAGTMNAVALAYGMHMGGKEKARETLSDFWHEVHKAGRLFNPIPHTPLEKFGGVKIDSAFSFFMMETMTRLFSPYQFNPLDINPLRSVLEKCIDFEALRCCSTLKLFVSATHVKSGQVCVFENDKMSVDVALASACLPTLFKAVEVEGEHYWDGGYMGNPSLFPLFYKTDSRDIVLIHINPIRRTELPTTAPAIMNRVNEITFNNSLLKDMRAIAMVKKLLENNMLNEAYRDNYKDILLHSVRSDKLMSELDVSSKMDTDLDFLLKLRDTGRDVMSRWLKKNFDKVGKADTVNLEKEFLHSVTDMFEN